MDEELTERKMLQAWEFFWNSWYARIVYYQRGYEFFKDSGQGYADQYAGYIPNKNSPFVTILWQRKEEKE